MVDLLQNYKPLKLHYTSCSTIENDDSSVPPIILIHGFVGNAASWTRIKFQLSSNTRRKVYAVDLRNHGKSEYGDEMTLKHLSADILQFMKDEKIERASFIGHSMGGRVAMELALHKPELVEKLVVEEAALSDISSDKYSGIVAFTKQVEKAVESMSVTMTESAAQKLIARIASKHLPQFTSQTPGETKEVFTLVYKDKNTGEFKFNCNWKIISEAMSNPDQMRNDLTGDPTYSGKTLFVKGELSVFPMDKDREAFLKHFPNAQFVTIKGAHHLSHSEKADAFVKAVSDFFLDKKCPETCRN